jgi:type I restriction-modification system DNA methylase subunit
MLERLIQLATGFTFKEARVEGRQKLIRLILPKKYETDLSSLTQDQVDLLLSTFEELLSEYDQTSVDQNYPQVCKLKKLRSG